MLAVLLIMVLAATFALVVVGAVHSLQVVEGADAAGWRADAAERAERSPPATRALRWRPSATTGTEAGGDRRQLASHGGSRGLPAPPSRAGLASHRGTGRHVRGTCAAAGDDLLLELRTEPWAMGVTCVGGRRRRRAAHRDGKRRLPRRLPSRAGERDVRRRSRLVTPLGAPADVVRGDAVPGGRCARRRRHLRPRRRDPRIRPGRASSPTTPTGTRACRSRKRGWPAPARSSCWPRSRGGAPGAGAERRVLRLDRALAGWRGRPRRRAVPPDPADGRSRHRGLAAARRRPPARRRPRRRRARQPRRDAHALRRACGQWAPGGAWAGGHRGRAARGQPERRGAREHVVTAPWHGGQYPLPGAARADALRVRELIMQDDRHRKANPLYAVLSL